jgi:hypothetical protein
MKKDEIITKIEAGGVLKEWHGIKKIYHSLNDKNITPKQFKAALIHFGDRLERTHDFGGFTTYFYKIKNQIPTNDNTIKNQQTGEGN